LKKRAVMSKSEFARGPLLIVQIILVAALVTALVLAAMNETDAPAAPAAPASPTSQATHSPSTAPVLATMTEIVPASTSTTEPTPTALRTETPVPTATPPREPIVRVGSGDLVFYPQKWVGPAVVRIRYEGDGPFVVWTQNNNGEREDLLANSAGAYRGDSLIDFAGSQRTLRFEVRAQEAGSWKCCRSRWAGTCKSRERSAAMVMTALFSMVHLCPTCYLWMHPRRSDRSPSGPLGRPVNL